MVGWTRQLLIFITLCTGFASSGSHADQMIAPYWGYSEFLSLFPQQKQLTQKLSATVENPPIPIDFKQEAPVSIAMVYPGKQMSDYWLRNIKAFELRLDELHIDYTLQLYSTLNYLDAKKQNSALYQALSSQPDYLIFTLDTGRHKKFIEHVLHNSNTKLILQNINTPFKEWEDKQPFLYVGFDHMLGSTALAGYFKSLSVTQNHSSRLHFSLLYFPFGYISAARGDTFLKVMQTESNAVLRSSYYTKATMESGYQATLEIVKNTPDVDFIYACSTDIALGAIKALIDVDREEIRVNGWGGGELELNAIQHGYLDVTVMRINDDTGVAMAEAVKWDLQGEEVPTTYSGRFEVVTSRDSSQRIETLKKLAFRYSDR